MRVMSHGCSVSAVSARCRQRESTYCTRAWSWAGLGGGARTSAAEKPHLENGRRNDARRNQIDGLLGRHYSILLGTALPHLHLPLEVQVIATGKEPLPHGYSHPLPLHLHQHPPQEPLHPQHPQALLLLPAVLPHPLHQFGEGAFVVSKGQEK